MYISNIDDVLAYAFTLCVCTLVCNNPSSWKIRGFLVCTPSARNHGRECEMFVQYQVRWLLPILFPYSSFLVLQRFVGKSSLFLLMLDEPFLFSVETLHGNLVLQ